MLQQTTVKSLSEILEKQRKQAAQYNVMFERGFTEYSSIVDRSSHSYSHSAHSSLARNCSRPTSRRTTGANLNQRSISTSTQSGVKKDKQRAFMDELLGVETHVQLQSESTNARLINGATSPNQPNRLASHELDASGVYDVSVSLANSLISSYSNTNSVPVSNLNVGLELERQSEREASSNIFACTGGMVSISSAPNSCNSVNSTNSEDYF